MVFVMTGMEDLAIYELCSKISDIKSKEDIHSVGHYTFPVGMTGGKTEVQKLVFETAVSFHICVNLGLYNACFLSLQLVMGCAEIKQDHLQC